jgi:hypothetical protein
MFTLPTITMGHLDAMHAPFIHRMRACVNGMQNMQRSHLPRPNAIRWSLVPAVIGLRLYGGKK